MVELIKKEFTERIIACAVDVHKGLGPGFIERVYQNAMSIELAKRGLVHDSERECLIRYQGRVVGKHRLDFLVQDEVVVELKAVSEITKTHKAVLKSYLKASGIKVGLILNFAKEVIDVCRVVN